MSLDPISAAFDLGKTAIERIWPDANKRAEELRKLEELRQKGDLAQMNNHVQLMLAQINVNLESAKHNSLFVAGARPAAIWAGLFSMVWSGIIHPMLTWVWAFMQMAGDPPTLIESSALVAIVTGLLGVAGMRSYDAKNGNKTSSLGSQ
jgi:hypothetical protein